jgi:hypothetical protein
MSKLNYYKYQQYHVECTSCSETTTRAHARVHAGLCKQCADALREKREAKEKKNEQFALRLR